MAPSRTTRRSCSDRPAAWRTLLLLEEVVEPAADVAGARRVGGGVALDRHAEREPGTVVACVLVGQPLGDRLFALEPPTRVEVGALPAGMDGGAAVRALLERGGRHWQDRSARPTPGDGTGGSSASIPPPSSRPTCSPRWPRSRAGATRWRGRTGAGV